MANIMFGNVSSGENKNLGRTIFYDNMSRGKAVRYSSCKGDSYEIEVFGLKNIERDSRPSPIKITHKLPNKSEHDLRLVVDFKHIYKTQKDIHLNLTKDSEAAIDNCPTCKVCFKGFNHAEINTIKNSEGESIDSDFIFGQINLIIKIKLEALGFKKV